MSTQSLSPDSRPGTEPEQQETPQPERPPSRQQESGPDLGDELDIKHDRLRHDNLEMVGSLISGNSSPAGSADVERVRNQFVDADQAGLNITQSNHQQRRRSRERHLPESLRAVMNLLRGSLAEDQIQEILETALEETSRGSALQLTPDQIENIAAEIFERIRASLANGELQANDDLLQAISFLLEEGGVSTADTEAIVEQIGESARSHRDQRLLSALAGLENNTDGRNEAARLLRSLSAEERFQLYAQYRQENGEAFALAHSVELVLDSPMAAESARIVRQLGDAPEDPSHAHLLILVEAFRDLTPEQRTELLRQLSLTDCDLPSLLQSISQETGLAQASLVELFDAGLSRSEFQDRLLTLLERDLHRQHERLGREAASENPSRDRIRDLRSELNNDREWCVVLLGGSDALRQYLIASGEVVERRAALIHASPIIQRYQYEATLARGSHDGDAARLERRLSRYEQQLRDSVIGDDPDALRLLQQHQSEAQEEAEESLDRARRAVRLIVRHWDTHTRESGKYARNVFDGLSSEEFEAANRIFQRHSYSDGQSLYQQARDEHYFLGTDDQIAYNATRGHYSNEPGFSPSHLSDEDLDRVSSLTLQFTDEDRASLLREDREIQETLAVVSALQSESPLAALIPILRGRSEAETRELLSRAERHHGRPLAELLAEQEQALIEDIERLNPRAAALLRDENFDILSEEGQTQFLSLVGASTEGARLFDLASRWAEMKAAGSLVGGESLSSERLQQVYQLRIRGLGALQGAVLAERDRRGEAVDHIAARVEELESAWRSALLVRSSNQVQDFRDQIGQERDRWRAMIVMRTSDELAYEIGLHENFHEDAETTEKEVQRARQEYQDYIREQEAFLHRYEQLRRQIEARYEGAYSVGAERGRELHEIITTLNDSTYGWDLGIVSFENNDKFYQALKQVRSPEEMALINASFERRYGVSLTDRIHEEFGDVEHDLAMDLLNMDYGAASAAELMLELDRFWGPRTDHLRRICAEGRLHEERFEEAVVDRYGERLENRINAARAHAGHHGYYQGDTLDPIEIRSIDDVFEYALHGDQRLTAQAAWEGDVMLDLVVQAHQKFGLNDDEKGIGLLLEQIAADGWIFNAETGAFELSPGAQRRLREFQNRFEEVYDEDFRAFIQDQMSGAELAWCEAILDGDRLAADAARQRFAFAGMGTDEQFSYESLDEVRLRLMAQLGITEHILQQDKQRAEEFERHYLAYIERLQSKYENMYGRSLEADARSEFTDSELSIFDALLQGGEFSDVHRLRLAMGGTMDGTDEAVIMEILERHYEQGTIDELIEEYGEFFEGRDLRREILSELSGDDDFDARDFLKGKPETAEEMMERLQARFDYEQSGILDGEVFGLDVGIGLNDLTPEMQEAYDRFVKLYEEYQRRKERDQSTADIERRLEALYNQAVNHCHSYRQLKNMVAEVATEVLTAAAVIGTTIASGGSLSLVWACVYAGVAAATRLTTKSLLKGSAYGIEEVGMDMALAGVEGGTAVLGAAATRGMNALLRANPVSRTILTNSGRHLEATVGSLVAKRGALESADEVAEIGARQLLSTLSEGAEMTIRGQAVRVTLDATEETIEAALKNSADDVMELLSRKLLVEAGEEGVEASATAALRQSALRQIRREVEDEWIELAAMYSRQYFWTRVGSGAAMGAVDGTVASAAEGFVFSALNPETWNQGFIAGLERVWERTYLYGSMGFGMGIAIGGAFSMRDRLGRMSRKISDADLERIRRWQTPEGRDEWFAARAVGDGAVSPPPIQLSDDGLALLNRRVQQHGSATVGDLQDAILASRTLSGRRQQRALRNLDRQVRRTQKQVDRIGSRYGEDSAEFTQAQARLDRLQAGVEALQARVSSGGTISSYDYLRLLGRDKNFYFYRSHPDASPPGTAQPELRLTSDPEAFQTLADSASSHIERRRAQLQASHGPIGQGGSNSGVMPVLGDGGPVLHRIGGDGGAPQGAVAFHQSGTPGSDGSPFTQRGLGAIDEGGPARRLQPTEDPVIAPEFEPGRIPDSWTIHRPDEFPHLTQRPDAFTSVQPRSGLMAHPHFNLNTAHFLNQNPLSNPHLLARPEEEPIARRRGRGRRGRRGFGDGPGGEDRVGSAAVHELGFREEHSYAHFNWELSRLKGHQLVDPLWRKWETVTVSDFWGEYETTRYTDQIY